MRQFWDFQNSAENDSAELYIYGPIVSSAPMWSDSVDAARFSDALRSLDGRDVTVHINSPGGDVFAAHAIHNQLVAYAGNVNVVVDGLAASAATIIAMAGAHITMPSNSLMMIHNPAMGLDARYTADELDKCANALRTVRKSIIAAYLKRVTVDKSQLEEMMDAETWLTAQECLDMGLADEIDGSIKSVLDGNNLIVNELKIDITNYKNKKGLAQCVAPVNKPKGAEKLSKSKLEEFLNALGLRIDDAPKTQPEAESAAPEQVTDQAKPMDAAKIAADAVAKERQRTADLDAMLDGNPAVEAIVNTAKKNGGTADDIRDYVEAVQGVKTAAQTQMQAMQADAAAGGVDDIAAGTSDTTADQGSNFMDLLIQAMNDEKGGKK
ncbi:head maturation protease, ClpP-related [uncultured Megasphaera sp.]|uniref:head maturation protease, ClpP-related n=1 Tax=uncultured Megasphaera sp. TaxID=165188 RepID=UPI0026007B76|nr:head maturation protease, ClpP-related [uncultured Megasphaera sp.]